MMRRLPIEIDLPERFFEREERCGFLVAEKAKRIMAVQLDLLVKFDYMCRRHDIKYQLGFGTLLGAIRHRGFIPWDNDVDVWMERAEFEKLCAIGAEFKEPYFLQTVLTDRKFLVLGARLRNSQTTGIVKTMSSPDYNCGIYLDIYPLDGYVESPVKLFVQLFQKHIISKCMEMYYDDSRPKSQFQRLMRVIRPFVRLIDYETWNRWFNLVTARYTKKTNRLSYVNGMVWSNRRKYWMMRDEIKNEVAVDFEGRKFPAPIGYGSILRRIYGSYMQCPPESDRGTHCADAVILDSDFSYKDYFKRILGK